MSWSLLATLETVALEARCGNQISNFCPVVDRRMTPIPHAVNLNSITSSMVRSLKKSFMMIPAVKFVPPGIGYGVLIRGSRGRTLDPMWRVWVPRRVGVAEPRCYCALFETDLFPSQSNVLRQDFDDDEQSNPVARNAAGTDELSHFFTRFAGRFSARIVERPKWFVGGALYAEAVAGDEDMTKLLGDRCDFPRIVLQFSHGHSVLDVDFQMEIVGLGIDHIWQEVDSFVPCFAPDYPALFEDMFDEKQDLCLTVTEKIVVVV